MTGSIAYLPSHVQEDQKHMDAAGIEPGRAMSKRYQQTASPSHRGLTSQLLS